MLTLFTDLHPALKKILILLRKITYILEIKEKSLDFETAHARILLEKVQFVYVNPVFKCPA